MLFGLLRTMIDLHCHILPGIDDGAPDTAVALHMARIAVSDGIKVIACTPHILPGVYTNNAASIRTALDRFADAVAREQIPLKLVIGADVHLAADLLADLRSGRVPTLAGSRYFLLEPPHHAAPPLLERFVFQLMAAGYVPILTHPERLSWIEGHYPVFQRLSDAGMPLQITAGSVLGRFGRRALYWSERMLDEGRVAVMATDAHHATRRTPRMAAAKAAVAELVGERIAHRIVATLPQRILENVLPSELRQP
jgi:protein-tyrosine phosphatase